MKKKLGTRTELKNINSFKFIGDAVEHEIERQIELLESGQRVRQETRLWDTKAKQTVLMRSKEEAADYRYFSDPDLPLLEVTDEHLERMRKQLPELPEQKLERYCKEMNLTPYEAEILVGDIALARYFEQAYKIHPSKNIVNWILRDVIGYVNDNKISLDECKVTPKVLADIIKLLEKGTINNHAAKIIFEDIASGNILAGLGVELTQVVKEKGLEQVGSRDELDAIIKQIVAENPAQVAEYKSGKDKMFGFFVGVAMKKTQGKGNPAIIQELLKKYLDAK